MYVEIGGRQTGKTTRLVDSVINFLTENPNKSALIVSKMELQRKSIRREVIRKCGEPCQYRTITSHKMLPTAGNTMKQFVDEFWSLPKENLIVDKNAYYCGTVNDNLNWTALEIIDYHRMENSLKPNKVLFKHKM